MIKPNPDRSSIFKILTLWTALLLLSSGMVHATVTVKAELDRNVLRIGEDANLTVTISADGGESIQQPTLPTDNEGLSFTYQGQSQSTNITFGGRTQLNVFSNILQYNVTALKAGRYTLDKISVSTDQGTVTANAITITVLAEGAPAPTPLSGTPQNPAPNSYGMYFYSDCNKKEAYVGEEITLTYMALIPYNREARLEQLQDRKGQFQGFWTENFDLTNKSYQKIQNFNGSPYNVVPLKRYFLYPLTPGDSTIDPLTLVCQVPTNPIGGFGIFMGSMRRINMQSDPVKIHVKPLPDAGKPSNFQGAVGSFNLTARVESAELKEGDPVTMKITLEGMGNIRNAPAPIMPDLSKFDVYDPTKKEDVQTTQDGVRGRVEYTYVIIPHDINVNQIGSVKYSFFNPAQAKYSQLETQPIALKIFASPRGTIRSLGPSGANRRSITRISEDFRFIAVTSAALTSIYLPIFQNFSYWVKWILPILLLIIAYIWKQRMEFFAHNPTALKSKKAPRLAGKLLSEARQSIRVGKNEAVYFALSKAVTDYIDNRWNLASAGLTSEELKQQLLHRGVQEDSTAEVIQILDEFDAARFSGAARDGTYWQRDYQMAERILSDLMRQKTAS